MELKDRVRKIDVNALTPEQVDSLIPQISDKMTEICDEAAKKANAILAIYGASCKIAIAFTELPLAMTPKTPAPIKRGRKPKANNLKV